MQGGKLSAHCTEGRHFFAELCVVCDWLECLHVLTNRQQDRTTCTLHSCGEAHGVAFSVLLAGQHDSTAHVLMEGVE